MNCLRRIEVTEKQDIFILRTEKQMNYNFSEFEFLKGKLLVIFGSSVGGSILNDYLQKHNFYPSHFSDNDPAKWGKEFCGKK